MTLAEGRSTAAASSTSLTGFLQHLPGERIICSGEVVIPGHKQNFLLWIAARYASPTAGRSYQASPGRRGRDRRHLCHGATRGRPVHHRLPAPGSSAPRAPGPSIPERRDHRPRLEFVAACPSWSCVPASAKARDRASRVLGKNKVMVVPRPGRVSIRTSPPDCRANPCTWLRPSPVPFPTSFVEKNGSKAFAATSRFMPVPVSPTEIAIKSVNGSPAGRPRSKSPDVFCRNCQPASVGHRIRLLIARLRMTSSSWVGSTITARRSFSSTVRPGPWRNCLQQQVPHARDQLIQTSHSRARC